MKRSITRFITRRLKLKVNEQKSAVARPVRRKFLGFSFTVRGPKRRIAGKALVRFKRRVRELTARARGIGIEQRAKELGDYLRGWKAYFGFCETPSGVGNAGSVVAAKAAIPALAAMATWQGAVQQAMRPWCRPNSGSYHCRQLSRSMAYRY